MLQLLTQRRKADHQHVLFVVERAQRYNTRAAVSSSSVTVWAATGRSEAGRPSLTVQLSTVFAHTATHTAHTTYRRPRTTSIWTAGTETARSVSSVSGYE